MEFSDTGWRKSSYSSETADCVEIAYPDWRKSSHSTDQTSCVEIAYPDWRKSSHSIDGADCVEIAYVATAPVVGIRDSKNPGGGHLTVPHTALRQLVSFG